MVSYRMTLISRSVLKSKHKNIVYMMAYFYTSRNAHGVLQVPKSLQCDIMHEYHSKPIARHLGRTKTLSCISRQNLWWRGIACSVCSYIHACHTCRQTKLLNRKPADSCYLRIQVPLGSSTSSGLNGTPAKD